MPDSCQNISYSAKSRFIAADVARGLAVIYFIWCHSVNIHIAWIDTWAMPVFFVVMGMFFKPTDTWRELIIKKVNTILVPFFLLSIPSYIQYAITLPFREFVMKLLNPFSCVHGVGWFLICFFWCYIIYYGLGKMTRNNSALIIIFCLFLSFTSFYASTISVMGYRIKLPFFISTSLTMLPFICIGDKLRGVLKKQFSKYKEALIAVLFLTTSMGGAILLNFKSPEYIANWYYGQSWLILVPLLLIGTSSILFICRFLPSFMSFSGEHSLLLLMVHPYILRIVRLFEISTEAIFTITLIVSLILIWALSKYLPIVEGKKKLIK